MANCSENRKSVPELFGSAVFNDDVMMERLPKDVYRSLRKTIDEGKDLDLTVANAVATAMKDWAVELGATHYTHWFQPLNGVTAEKHDSFISPTSDGRVIMQFSGKELIKGEPDASSFPSGGLRATFEARGYTAWDPTSYAFVKGGSLYIPTAFCSYSGEVLDKKTPLLRSMEALSTQALGILRLLGDDKTQQVITTVGPEQEYFLIDKELYKKRRDLMFTGRTLFGARAPKGQELEDHYYGAIKPRVAEFMRDLDRELWKLGILAKTKHNEVAPAQHELAPIFSTTNTACDHNQLTMEVMRNVADRHGLVCLLHEKPFAGVNGSGKHNNWSLQTDTGKNLLDPGKRPWENLPFLLILAAVVKGVDEYQDLLRISVASAGNDHRLGANEAPPAIISMFLGDDLTALLTDIETGKPCGNLAEKKLQTGVRVLPDLNMDNTDRNRTSPFAFTGNKFEFRSLGSAISIACPNIMLNTIVAEELRQFSQELKGQADMPKAVNALVRRVVSGHKRIIFNGDGYSEQWVEEARRRGLLNLRTTVDALPRYLDQKNVELFRRHRIYTEAEMEARYETIMEEYVKTLNIESLTMTGMVRQEIIPAVSGYVSELAQAVAGKRAVLSGLPCTAESQLIEKLSTLLDRAYAQVEELEESLGDPRAASENILSAATHYRDTVIPAMERLRLTIDELEQNAAREHWPYPTYADLMFSI
ncbi:glutamine synthetase III [Acutalibacter muris]|jgi:glutamine synthetase|uniref:Glutamine synthetase III n=1 Tax=Acutalibacter muris TaxID=1796620 RepID=A0A1Z2XT03_9FIRM|nr:glutamine synthetase III [Acutalibacter muris]ANU55230.1 glutamine synthetase type III [Hungateiclostridiaceae bacterium KB18]ASB41535.1 glutamine synthetase type III [Acutalibacter muris]MCI9192055.1 glutamine synthetase type III [Acutalibacter muris]QQR30795.1 glutamine synthetase III [Acutalibacter muris]